MNIAKDHWNWTAECYWMGYMKAICYLASVGPFFCSAVCCLTPFGSFFPRAGISHFFILFKFVIPFLTFVLRDDVSPPSVDPGQPVTRPPLAFPFTSYCFSLCFCFLLLNLNGWMALDLICPCFVRRLFHQPSPRPWIFPGVPLYLKARSSLP